MVGIDPTIPSWSMNWDENEVKYQTKRKYEIKNVKVEVN